MANRGNNTIGVDQFMHPQWPHYGAPQEIVKILEKTYQYGLGGWRTFQKWVELCHLALDGLPNAVHQVANGVPYQDIRDTPEQQEAWDTAVDGWRPEAIELFAQAFHVLLKATVDDYGQLSYADVVGSVFQLFGISKSAQQFHGIFFTPFNVAHMMAQMLLIGVEAELKQRFVQALEHESLAGWSTALSLGVVAANALEADEQGLKLLGELLSLAKGSPAWQPIRICDPCCGSGVMLLAAAKSVPRWAIDLGFVEFYGVDINYLCVEMCRLNLRLYGITSLGIKPADWLSLVELQSLPEPYPELYEKAITSADPERQYWIEQVRSAGAVQTSFWPAEKEEVVT